MTWTLFALNRPVHDGYLRNLPCKINDSSLDLFIEYLTNAKVCIGNKDYHKSIQKKGDVEQLFLGKDGEDSAWIESSIGHTKLDASSFDTIRSAKCLLLSGQ